MQWLGYNPIASTSDDTPAKWANLGPGYCEYNQTGKINNQPNQYGMLISYNKGSEIFQIWQSLNAGQTYYRSGNSNGWGKSWTRYLDASDLNHTVNPNRITTGYTSQRFYLNTHPENSGAIIPFINNDLAFLRLKGGSYKVYRNGTVICDTSAATASLVDNVFDGSPSYWQQSITDLTSIVFEITLHKQFAYSNTFYVDFGSSNWRAKSITVEVMHSTYDTDWVQKGSITNNSIGEWMLSYGHTPANGTAGNGFNKMRITFKDFMTGGFRIAQIGLLNYGSYGARDVFLARDGGVIYGTIWPQNNAGANLGTSSKAFATVYGNTFTGNAASASKLGTSDVGSSAQPMYLKAGVATKSGYTFTTATPVSNSTDTTIPTSLAVNKAINAIDKSLSHTSVGSDETFSVQLGSGGTLGGFKTGDTISANTSLETIIKKLLMKQVPPTYAQPTAGIANNSGTAAGSYEYGTTITPKLKATFTKNDAGNLTSFQFKKNGSNIGSALTVSPAEYVDTAFTLTATTYYSATASYAEGAVKKDNLGQDYSTGHITAGSKNTSNYTFTPYRQGYFCGYTTDKNTLTSNTIRGLQYKKNGAYSATTVKITVKAGAQRVVLAAPAANKGMTKVLNESALNADVTSTFTKSTINVQGANGYDAISYNIWTFIPDVPYGQNAILAVTFG